MTANRLFRAIALLWIVGSLGVVAQEPAAAGDLYLILLQPDQRDRAPFDPAALGGHLEHRNGSRMAVRMTAQAAAEAAMDPRVRTLQRVTLGIPGRRDTPAVEELAQWIPNGSDSLSSGIYTYDGSGNTQSIGPNGRGVKDEFTYDRFARLATAKVHSGTSARTQNYVYDNAGNLTRVVNVGGVILDLPVNAATNRLSNAIATYDTVGHLTHTPLANYTYDQTGMMSQTGGLTYVYTAADERILVVPTVGSGTWRWTLRDLQGRKVREYESVRGEDFLWLEDDYYDGQRLIASERETAEGGRRHYHPDHLGTPRLITNAGGQQISTHDYLPFGVEITSIHQEAARGYLREQTAQFTGHERDVTPGLSEHTAYLDYMHARYYNPNWGRFLTVDPGRDWDASQPQSWNLYAYVRNNPITLVDPNGRQAEKFGPHLKDLSRWDQMKVHLAVSKARNEQTLPQYKQLAEIRSAFKEGWSAVKSFGFGLQTPTPGVKGVMEIVVENPGGNRVGETKVVGSLKVGEDAGAVLELGDKKIAGSKASNSPDSPFRLKPSVALKPVTLSLDVDVEEFNSEKSKKARTTYWETMWKFIWGKK